MVEKLGKALIEVGLNRARVDGHTDSNGDEAYNQQLSLKRARSVADVLVSVGMPRGTWISAAAEKRRPSPTTRPLPDERKIAGLPSSSAMADPRQPVSARRSRREP